MERRNSEKDMKIAASILWVGLLVLSGFIFLYHFVKMTSKFRIFGVAVFLLILSFGMFLAVFVPYVFLKQNTSNESFLYVYFILVLIISLVFVLIIELPKIRRLKITEDGIRMESPLGGTSKSYMWQELDGFKTQTQSTKYVDYEILRIIKDGICVQEISSFYIRNFEEVKNGLALHLKDLGYQPFSFINYIKEAFSRGIRF